ANYWGNYSSKARSTSSLVLSNTLVIEQSDGSKITYTGDLENAVFGNCIIFGNNSNEIELGNNDESAFNYFFDHCILQVPDTFNTADADHYKSIWKGANYDPEFIDPFDEYNYALDTLSPAKDAGSQEYAKRFPLDILNKDRTADEGPDLGAFERIEKKDEE
ncbi:MAG TPA: hypothetical protein VKA38_15075, partial [Draconibacterium sp.]|nr:hypothetical protein [Draconibacterium sp.]